MATETKIVLAVRASTRSSRSEIRGYVDGQLRVRTTAAPVDGKANKDIIRQLSREFGTSPSQISLIRGDTSRNKVFRICNARIHPGYLADDNGWDF